MKILKVSALILILILVISSCGLQNNEELNIQSNIISTTNINEQQLPRAQHEVVDLTERFTNLDAPIAVVEVEIVSFLSDDIISKAFDYELPKFVEFYNAKINKIYYIEEEFEIKDNEDIIFNKTLTNLSPSFNTGDRFICIMVNSKDRINSFAKNLQFYLGLFDINSIYDIAKIDDVEYIYARIGNKNTELGDISLSMKEDEKNGSLFDKQKMRYSYKAKYDVFVDSLINYLNEMR